jgi:hypothetical protein
MINHRHRFGPDSPRSRRIWRRLLIITLALYSANCQAHQAPYTNILLDVNTKQVAVELQIPIPELALSFGQTILKDPATIVQQYGDRLRTYLQSHIHAYVEKNTPWQVEITDMDMDRGAQTLSGPPFWELRAHLILVPNKNEDTRNFFLAYDVVMHQVINHYALVSIRTDWARGLVTDSATEVGVIRRDMRTNTVLPFEVNLQKGNSWQGFAGMFALGMEHIKTGTDHLLFILTLLLPACLLVTGKRWAGYGGFRYSITRLLRIITAFTIGHSITLLIGVLRIVSIPSQYIEITIAVSILVSAIHAIRPLFYGRELFIALGFGLIHGLAFSQTLQNLHLQSTDLALSVLGFNLGIEIMQIFVIAITIPWFVIMSKTDYFRPVKNGFAVIIGAAAIGLIVQRVTGDDNLLSTATDQLVAFSSWLIAGLCILSMILLALTKRPMERPDPQKI